MTKEDQEPLVCVRCHTVAEEKDKYCIHCGAPLINTCSDDAGLLSNGCKKKNRPDAAYCAYCGQPTIFNQAGIISGYLS